MASTYHDMTDEELNTQLDNARKELRELRFSYAVARSLQNPSRIGQLKRNIARILTVKREKEIKAAKA